MQRLSELLFERDGSGDEGADVDDCAVVPVDGPAFDVGGLHVFQHVCVDALVSHCKNDLCAVNYGAGYVVGADFGDEMTFQAYDAVS